MTKSLFGLFNMLPGWLWAAIAGALTLSHCAMGNRLDAAKLALADAKTAHATHLATQAAAAATAEGELRKTISDLSTSILEDAYEAQKRLDQAVDDLGRARSAGQRLRDQLDALSGLSCSSAPAGGAAASSSAGDPAAAAADLRAHVQSRLDEAADGIAGFGDGAATAAEFCERSYTRAREKLKAIGAKP